VPAWSCVSQRHSLRLTEQKIYNSYVTQDENVSGGVAGLARARDAVAEASSGETKQKEPPMWGLWKIPLDIRRRIKAAAALSDKTIPETVEHALRYWLDAGCPL